MLFYLQPSVNLILIVCLNIYSKFNTKTICLLCMMQKDVATYFEFHLILTFDVYSRKIPYELSLNGIINFLLCTLSDKRGLGSRVYGYTLEITALRKQMWENINLGYKDKQATSNSIKKCIEKFLKHRPTMQAQYHPGRSKHQNYMKSMYKQCRSDLTLLISTCLISSNLISENIKQTLQ